MSNNWNQNNRNNSYGATETVADPVEEFTEVEETHIEPVIAEPVEVEVEPEETEADEVEAKGAKAKPGAKGPSRALVRRIAVKTLEVLEADEAARVVVSALVGSTVDTVELATSIMVAPRTARAPLNDIDELSKLIKDNEQFRAAISAGSLVPAQRKAMWAALVAVNGATGNVPTDTQKAVLELLGAIKGLGDEARTHLEAAAELLKRS